jgi:hypothetical protein
VGHLTQRGRHRREGFRVRYAQRLHIDQSHHLRRRAL